MTYALPRKVAAATVIGTTMEWYDFMLYGTASALIFNKQFFPTLSPAAGTLAAFSTFAVGFGARPIGGLLFGHFGDRIGRKATLVVSLLLMGVSSTLIGAVPNYASIGFWAPALLVALRLLQGIGLGGEGTGAVVLSMEHAPHGRVNRYASYPQLGTPAGLIIANAVFLGTSALLPDAAFLDWGWRIPFLLSAILVGLGLVVRLGIDESPVFATAAERGELVAFPLRDSLRLGVVRLVLISLATIATGAVVYLFMAFTLTYGTKAIGYSRNFLLLAVIIASIVWCATMPLWGALGDKFGTRRVFAFGMAALLVWCAVYFPLLNTGNAVAAYIALLGMGAVLPIGHSVGGIIVAELFPAAVRYSGASLVIQVSVALGGGFAPLIAAALWDATGGSGGVTCYAMGLSALSLISTVLLAQTGRPSAPATAAVSRSVTRSGDQPRHTVRS
ncbi:MFS transporter [Nocardia arthritidis]|uniref:MFS transporter n=1 Tax=Nocardia arthritidis TaxID=228602 RepID=A0A6G9YIY5_9NOCA|nr:MFS transporter [Nocardia arthritidis]QIS13219.1 MFS transporter [Nocardia arthritidis]